ncbi:MAG: [FeFe] hydrogenase H-cluster maturation GTPase HydF [Elusimicrobiota bacterium]|jgi:[FeFe] hydrogenase H-cluster maturation GTPase HydF|nr:[FeFe] hydrogenase H-cluster maturation GTPase HydF [Elusimicrobiota bacterium]
MKALTLQIGIFGRTNVGKSSLMNFITNQNTSIVSEFAGTTTDVVSKQMELNPLGPVTLFDTAGLDDTSVLGNARVGKSKASFDACDVVLLMCEANTFGKFEEEIVEESRKKNTVLIIVIGKADLHGISENFLDILKNYSKNVLIFSSKNSNRDVFLDALKNFLIAELPDNYIENYLSLRNIIKKNDTVILVMPIDKGAPRGKIIMPQIQTIRHVLDLNACSFTVQDTEYEAALKNLNANPVLVITDSQAIERIAKKTPSDVKLTTFSTIYAADKSDIVEMAKGAGALNKLKDGDKILIAEACTHHASIDDIGRVKLPKWISKYSKKNLEIDYVSGQDYPKNIDEYRIIIHCGACTLNRKAMLSRLNKALEKGIPITNYGIAISVFHKTIEKTLEIFPQALEAYKIASGASKNELS